MLLSVGNITKTYNGRDILKDISFHINEHDKCALVGINGCGKTTLINILVGSVCAGDNVYSSYGISPDSGTVTISRGSTVGYLPQNAILESTNSIYEEVLNVKRALLNTQDKLRDMEEAMGSLEGEALKRHMEEYHNLSESFDRAGGYMIQSEVTGTLKGLGFADDDLDTPVNILSGGQKTRVALAKLLVGSPDFIILDEPTNHLDISSIAWLEGYLKSYKGTVLLVSHDRYFLDRIVDKVFEIENGNLSTFTGNYSDYAIKKESLRNAALNAYLNQQRDIKHQKEVIEKLRSFNREKSVKRADSRQKMLDKTELIDKPEVLNDRMQIILTPRYESGRDVLRIQGLEKSYDSVLFSDFDMLLRRGEHVAVIGDNGTGKTTLLRLINGLAKADAGTIEYGSNVTIGYYDQEHHVLDDSKTVFDEISDSYPSLKETEIRNTLAAFLFTGEDVFKRIGSLSGGEKGRVSLAKLMLSEANLLILDEPTNHLDITSKEILESAINNYTGTVLYVSHDRYFINRTAERILCLKDGTFKEYLGNYDYYLEKTLQQNNDSAPSSLTGAGTTAADKGSGADDYKAMKAAAAEEKKKAKKLAEIEDKIDNLEAAIKENEEKLNDPQNGHDAQMLIKLQNEHDELQTEYEKCLEIWEELSE